MNEAQAMGAIALFGETYDETVRIVEIGGPWSVELCGGTHVEHSSQIGPVAITGESSVGSGLRRVEAAVGIDAFRRLAAERTLVNQLASTLKVQPSELPARIENLLEKLRSAEKELAGLRAQALGSVAGTLAQSAVDAGGVALVAGSVPDGTNAGDLRTLASDVRGRLGERPGVVALFAPAHASVPFAVAVNQAGIARGLAAGDLAKSLLPVIEGRGGGKKDLAQGAGTRPDLIPEAIDALRAAVLAAAG
jgi:alanyl-tRNA synthetase